LKETRRTNMGFSALGRLVAAHRQQTAELISRRGVALQARIERLRHRTQSWDANRIVRSRARIKKTLGLENLVQRSEGGMATRMERLLVGKIQLLERLRLPLMKTAVRVPIAATQLQGMQQGTCLRAADRWPRPRNQRAPRARPVFGAKGPRKELPKWRSCTDRVPRC